jgi:aldose 1-epimerase
MNELLVLENAFWQVGILPQTGASIAFGRVRHGDAWVDVMRPTAEADYGNASNCSSFIMMPWSNRIRDARFRFRGVDYPLEVSGKDGTAIHGDVRKRPWQVDRADAIQIDLHIDSAEHAGVNFPFRFYGKARYALDECDFYMALTLTNMDTQPMPAGFGHHPYFVKADGVQLEIPFAQEYELIDSMPTKAAVAIRPEADFRTLRPLGDTVLDHLLTGRMGDAPSRIVYPDVGLSFYSDPIFQHVIAFAPPGKLFFAVEPVSNINDGFNLFEQGIADTGVFVLEAGESRSGSMHLTLDNPQSR